MLEEKEINKEDLSQEEKENIINFLKKENVETNIKIDNVNKNNKKDEIK